VVLNCADPFDGTADPLRAACLRTHTGYLDIAGDIESLEDAAASDREATDVGTSLLPGVGFDVTATDCLAAHLAERLPSAERIAFAIDGMGTFSPGTLKAIVDGFSRAGAIRVDGRIRDVPAAWRRRQVDFDVGTKPTVTVPWGGVSTTYHTTGIRNVEVYAAVPAYAVPAMRLTRPVAPLFGRAPLRSVVQRLIDATVSGPTPEERSRSVNRIRGEANRRGGRARRRPPPHPRTRTTSPPRRPSRRPGGPWAARSTPGSTRRRRRSARSSSSTSTGSNARTSRRRRWT
jgi:short subunit dehydrogenase-like uncharacterized protein